MVQKTKLFTTMVCRSVILCVQYIDVDPPSIYSLLCAPPIPCLFLLFLTLPASFSPLLLFLFSLAVMDNNLLFPSCVFLLFVHLSVCFLFKIVYAVSSNPVIYTHMPCHTSSYTPAVEHRRRRQRRSFLQGTTVQ